MEDKIKFLKDEAENRIVDTEIGYDQPTCVWNLVNHSDTEITVDKLNKDVDAFIKDNQTVVLMAAAILTGQEFELNKAKSSKEVTLEDITSDVVYYILATCLGISIYVLKILKTANNTVTVYWEYCPPLFPVQNPEECTDFITLTEENAIWYPIRSRDKNSKRPEASGIIGVFQKRLQGIYIYTYLNCSFVFFQIISV